MNHNEIVNVIFAGVGGQGNILVSHLLADAALEKGYQVRLTETFGAATRGGSVFSCVRIGDAGAPLPRKHSAQVIVGLEPLECLRLAVQYLAPGGSVVINNHPWVPVDVSAGRVTYPEQVELLSALQKLGAKVVDMNATQTAEELGSSRMMNIVLLGGLMALGLLDIENELLFAQMEKRWKPQVSQANREAFQKGFEYVARQLTVQA